MAELLTFDPSQPGILVDLDRLVSSRLLVQANSGGGKSWMLRYILEQTYGKVQQIILDPEGEFPTLREKFDYLLVGEDADLPVNVRTARMLSRRVMELGASTIIDLYSLKLDQRRAYVQAFLEGLMHLPRELWHPCLIVIDECHVFCPEKGAGESVSKEAVITLATQGRKRGFALVAATQRLAKLHKDCAAELLNKLIGRTGLDVDMSRAGDELGMTKADRMLLRDLSEGSFYAFGPAISNKIEMVRSGQVQTTHPRPGVVLPPSPPPTERIVALIGKMEDLDHEAEREAKSLEDAKREITRLEAELRRTKRAPQKEELDAALAVKTQSLTNEIDRLKGELMAAPSESAIASEVAIAIKPFEDRNVHLEWIVTELKAIFTDLLPVHDHIISIDERINGILSVEKFAGQREASERSLDIPKEFKFTPPKAEPAKPSKVAEGVTGPEQRILNAIRWMEAIGVETPALPAVAFLAGYTFGGGGFNNPKGSLRTKGHVVYTGGGIQLTDTGRDLAAEPESAPSLDHFHSQILFRLPGPEQRVLKPLLDAYPESMTNEDLASAANYKAGSGGFNNPKGRLRTLELITYPQPGFARAADILFPESLK